MLFFSRQTVGAKVHGREGKMPFPNPAFDPVAYEKTQLQVRQRVLPQLERQHAAFLEPDWAPSGGWWEKTGK